jgi:hypothetical protein
VQGAGGAVVEIHNSRTAGVRPGQLDGGALPLALLTSCGLDLRRVAGGEGANWRWRDHGAHDSSLVAITVCLSLVLGLGHVP